MCITLLFSCHLFSQGFIKGNVLDSTRNGFPFVNIALINVINSSNVKGTISNETGKYEFDNVKPGSYLLKFFSIGYLETYSSAFNVDSASQITIPDKILKSSGINLNEVSVTSIKKTIEFKNGMTILNVENSIMAAGNTVLDVLKRIPGVTVDNKNNISISGKQGVRIMLDGRMQQLSLEQVVAMLSSMPADLVSTIEVMKSPPVKYDAEGNAGIINIVTKKIIIKGYNGSINYNPGMGQRFGNSVNASFNFKSNKVTLYSNVNAMYKTFFDRYDFTKNVQYEGNTTIFNQTGVHENLRKFLSAKIGLDYELTKKTTVGVLVSSSINDANPTEHGYTSMNGYNDTGFDHYNYTSDEKTIWTNPNYNFNAEHRFDTLGTTLNLSIDYAGFKNTSDRKSESQFFKNDNSYAKSPLGYDTKNKSNVSIFTQKLDFQKNITSSWLMETGVKSTFVKQVANFIFERRDTITAIYQSDTAYTNTYHYDEAIVAGYLNFKKQLKKGSLALGVRAEHTNITGRNITSGFSLTKSYLNFFPNLSFDYELTAKQNLQLNYTRRLDRPDYSQLNPFKRFEDQYYSATGNPNLNPQYSDNIDVTHIYNQWITNSVGYSYFTQIITGVTLQNDSSKQSIQTQINLSNGSYSYYNLFIQKEVKKWWSLQFSTNIYYIKFNGAIASDPLKIANLSSNFYINNDFILPKNFKVQLTAHYDAPHVFATTYMKARGSVDFAIKKTFYKEKLNIMFQFLDMFYTDIDRSYYKFENQYSAYNSKDDTRRFRLTLNYKFGKMNIDVNEKHSNDQEKGRLKKD
ncbi:MAG: TonB-dependent receptor [Burkholderiales bacterium]|nr:TonB-dependent receptor [Bacteroidia bacterium]